MATATSQTDSQTGTQNSQYALVSILYHALEGAATYEQYVEDAKSDDDSELASFFEKVRSQSCDLADEAKSLLKSRL